MRNEEPLPLLLTGGSFHTWPADVEASSLTDDEKLLFMGALMLRDRAYKSLRRAERNFDTKYLIDVKRLHDPIVNQLKKLIALVEGQTHSVERKFNSALNEIDEWEVSENMSMSNGWHVDIWIQNVHELITALFLKLVDNKQKREGIRTSMKTITESQLRRLIREALMSEWGAPSGKLRRPGSRQAGSRQYNPGYVEQPKSGELSVSEVEQYYPGAVDAWVEIVPEFYPDFVPNADVFDDPRDLRAAVLKRSSFFAQNDKLSVAHEDMPEFEMAEWDPVREDWMETEA